MSTEDKVLVLTALEAAVVEAALELYLEVRPVSEDRRYEYRYRAAQAVLESLQRVHSEFGTLPPAPEEETTRSDDELPLRRSARERLED